MKTNRPEISVIIPALNEEQYISYPIRGLKKQTFKNFETIVVDGGSRDRTVEIAKGSARVIIDKRKGIGRARNEGAKRARGKILLFIDADTEPRKDLLASYANAFEDKEVVVATGPILPLEKSGFRMKIGYMLVSVFFAKISIALGRPSIIGSNFAVRKTAFDRVNGFKCSLMTYEDWNLSNRLKRFGKAKYIDSAVVYTSVRRVKKWGIRGFFVYHVDNIFRYNILKKPKTDYNPIR